MRHCTRCLYPDTKPDLIFNAEGVCSACVNFEKRKQLDWTERAEQCARLLSSTPSNGSGYDCVVPSSGGKDSHWQVIQLIKLGARPLVVTASTCMLTEIGRKNIDNLARYATTIEVTPNRAVRATLNRIGLTRIGDISYPEHLAIFSIPFRIACDLGIPLIFYGESPQREYGGPIGSEESFLMTRRWVTEFGGMLGLRTSDLFGELSRLDLKDYQLPSDEKLATVKAYFLGQFYPWHSNLNARVAKQHGMIHELPTVSNWWDFENLDNAQTGLHDFFCYLKYGYGRMTAQISVDIRNGSISREYAAKLVGERDGLFPSIYAGVSYRDVLDQIKLTHDDFRKVCHKFTNKRLFETNQGDEMTPTRLFRVS